MKNSLLEKLNLFGYKYFENENRITIKLDFAQEVIVDFSVPNKVIISDRLTGHNLLTGLIKIKLKYALIYSVVVMLIFTIFLFLSVNHLDLNIVVGLIIVGATWTIMSFLYYCIRLETMKKTIYHWLK